VEILFVELQRTKKGEHESKAEFYIIDGEISEIKIINVKGVKPLKGSELKNFKVFLEAYAEKIVENGLPILYITKRLILKK